MPDKPIARRAKKKKKRKRERNKESAQARAARDRVRLTPKELIARRVKDNEDVVFATEYLRTMDPMKAAEAIGLGSDADSAAWTYLKRPGVQKIVKEEFDKRTDAAGVTEERIIRELEALAFSVVKDFVAFDDDRVSLIPSGSLTRTQAAAIQSVQSKPTRSGGTVVSIKMYDKLKALELLMRCKGMINTDGKSAFGAQDAREIAERIRGELDGMNQTVPVKEGNDDGNA